MSLAFVFPGQGSQKVGMLADFADAYPVVHSLFAQASSALEYDLWDIVCNGPEEKLNSTDITQPAMLTAGVATWNVWLENKGTQPAFMAGHSLGEYSALVCAGVIDFKEAVKLVSSRGKFMQQAVAKGEGAMAAILGLSDDDVRAVCSEASQGEVIEAVNYNSVGQVVIAGQTSAVERATEIAKSKGAKRALILPVSVPSHCQLMKPAADQLAKELESIEFNAPAIPVINNVDVAAPSDPAEIKQALIKQLYQPVRWVETIQNMAALGVTEIIECGPGKVLLGLNKRIDKTLTHGSLDSIEALKTQLAGE